MTTLMRLTFVATVIHIGFSIYNGGRAYGEDFILPLILIWTLKFILDVVFDKNSEAKQCPSASSHTSSILTASLMLAAPKE